MKKIVVIGANEFQFPLVRTINELGYESHVFAWPEGAVAKDIATQFYPISITEKEQILEICKQINADAVLTAGSDLASITVNYVCENMGLIGNSKECTLVSTNKFEMRSRFKARGIPSPEFIKINDISDIKEIEKLKLPLIVKPTDRSGSRGITKITNTEQLYCAVNNAINESFNNEAVVEEYIEGNEYSVETISYKGKHQFLNITQKFTTGSPHFIETMHLQPPNNLNISIEEVTSTVFRALDALEIKYGASHSEIKVTPEGEIKIIEIGARMGGDFIGSHLVKISTGFDFLKGIIDVSLGQFECVECLPKKSNAFVKFIFNEADISKFELIQKQYKDLIYEKNIKNEFRHSVKSSADRFGYYILDINEDEVVSNILEYIR